MRTVTESGSLNSQDFLDKTAHQISQDYRYRRNDRKQLEEQWDEIDRQVSMKAKPSNIDKKSGRAAPGSEWMPFIELPWQAQTLELIPADARRLQFPSERKWFFAVAHDSDEALLATIRLCERYITDKFFPDKAIETDDVAHGRPPGAVDCTPAQLKAFAETLGVSEAGLPERWQTVCR